MMFISVMLQYFAASILLKKHQKECGHGLFENKRNTQTTKSTRKQEKSQKHTFDIYQLLHPLFRKYGSCHSSAYGRVYVRNLPKAWQNEDTKQWIQSKHLPEPADVAMFHKPRADCASAYITWMKATTGQLQTFCEQLRVDWLTHKQVEAVLALDGDFQPKSRPWRQQRPEPYNAPPLQQRIPTEKALRRIELDQVEEEIEQERLQREAAWLKVFKMEVHQHLGSCRGLGRKHKANHVIPSCNVKPWWLEADADDVCLDTPIIL